MQVPEKILREYHFNNTRIALWVPHFEQLQKAYQTNRQAAAFPFWAKVWPSAIALTQYLSENQGCLFQKNVLELAAGLGLPSLFAATVAKTVLCSDYDRAAVELIKENIKLNGYTNIQAECIDWQLLPGNIGADTVLLSDINYNPEEFAVLYKVIQFFLSGGATVLLSTPQRLVAKDFISQLLPWCVHNEEREVVQDGTKTMINILVLAPPMMANAG